MEQVNIKLRLNVDESSASELYDEIEGHLALCFESILEKEPLKVKGLSADFVSYDPHDCGKLERIITPLALTGFLSEKLKNNSIRVENVKVYQEVASYSKNIFVQIFVPNVWAMNYGKETEVEIEQALEYFKNPVKEQTSDAPKLKFSTSRFNGVSVEPIIGSLYYDQLQQTMKCWDGVSWKQAL